jgi:hypothetical protein
MIAHVICKLGSRNAALVKESVTPQVEMTWADIHLGLCLESHQRDLANDICRVVYEASVNLDRRASK